MMPLSPSDFDGPSDLDEFLVFACDEAVFGELLSRGDFGCCFILKALKSDEPLKFEMTAKFKLPPLLVEQCEGRQLKALSDFVEMIKGVIDEGEAEAD